MVAFAGRKTSMKKQHNMQEIQKMRAEAHQKLSEREPSPCSFTFEQVVELDNTVQDLLKPLAG